MTSRRESLTDLAERVERASGPDMALDREVVAAIFGPDRDMLMAVTRGTFRPTKSLDAAMSLVAPAPFDGRAMNVALERDDDTWGAVVWHPLDSRPDIGPQFTSPALALTAAALRSRAMMMGE